MIDLGFLLYLKVLRLKLSAFQLVANIKGMELAAETDSTLCEIEYFYLQLEYKLKQSHGLLGYSPIPEYLAPRIPKHPLSFHGSRHLFNTFTGFFDDVPDGGNYISLPTVDLLAFYDHVDINKVQENVVKLVQSAGGRSSIRQLASQLEFGSQRKTIAMVFMACLFLEMDGQIMLNQLLDDIVIRMCRTLIS
jgi:hypothetical protein